MPLDAPSTSIAKFPDHNKMCSGGEPRVKFEGVPQRLNVIAVSGILPNDLQQTDHLLSMVRVAASTTHSSQIRDPESMIRQRFLSPLFSNPCLFSRTCCNVHTLTPRYRYSARLGLVLTYGLVE